MCGSQYTTLRRSGTEERQIRRSRFIGICRPITAEQDAVRLIEEARTAYPEASHYVYAWRTNAPMQLQRFSDDGEPRGTGGLPLLNALLSAGIDRGAVVVIRYFGGILLGAGVLTRSYAGTAHAAILAAQPVRYVKCPLFQIEADYTVYSRLHKLLEHDGYAQRDPVFGAGVRWLVGTTEDRVGQLRRSILDLSAGKAEISPVGSDWIEDPSSGAGASEGGVPLGADV